MERVNVDQHSLFCVTVAAKCNSSLFQNFTYCHMRRTAVRVIALHTLPHIFPSESVKCIFCILLPAKRLKKSSIAILRALLCIASCLLPRWFGLKTPRMEKVKYISKLYFGGSVLTLINWYGYSLNIWHQVWYISVEGNRILPDVNALLFEGHLNKWYGLLITTSKALRFNRRLCHWGVAVKVRNDASLIWKTKWTWFDRSHGSG
jgi:hypothetical protein